MVEDKACDWWRTIWDIDASTTRQSIVRSVVSNYSVYSPGHDLPHYLRESIPTKLDWSFSRLTHTQEWCIDRAEARHIFIRHVPGSLEGHVFQATVQHWTVVQM